MFKIDSHQHFWEYNPVRDTWINDAMAGIKRDFLPEDLQPILKKNGVTGCVAVQSDQSNEENDFHLHISKDHDFIMGIVGWIDLEAPDVEEQLSRYSLFKKMKGFRHVLQNESQRDFMLRPKFKRGINLLKNFNFTYDLLVLADQLKHAKELVALFPQQYFVVDHLGKPDIKKKEISIWKKDIIALAAHENVYCKVSGMITEADWHNWHSSDFTPYLDVLVESFGIHRLMFGSDWPVCLVSGSYEEMLNVVKDYFASFSKNEQQLFFGGNAIQFYNLVI